MMVCEALGTMYLQHLAIEWSEGLAKEPMGNKSEGAINLVIIIRRNVADTPRPKGELSGRYGFFSFLCYPLRNRGKVPP